MSPWAIVSADTKDSALPGVVANRTWWRVCQSDEVLEESRVRHQYQRRTRGSLPNQNGFSSYSSVENKATPVLTKKPFEHPLPFPFV